IETPGWVVNRWLWAGSPLPFQRGRLRGQVSFPRTRGPATRGAMRHLLVSHLLVSIALWGQAALWGLVASGCVAPPPPSELAADAARDLNLAARFGQLGAAASHTADGARESFLERRAQRGKYLRIVDTELAGFEMDTH